VIVGGIRPAAQRRPGKVERAIRHTEIVGDCVIASGKDVTRHACLASCAGGTSCTSRPCGPYRRHVWIEREADCAQAGRLIVDERAQDAGGVREINAPHEHGWVHYAMLYLNIASIP